MEGEKRNLASQGEIAERVVAHRGGKRDSSNEEIKKKRKSKFYLIGKNNSGNAKIL